MNTRETIPDKAKITEEVQPSTGGRWAAGEDPVKRQQIIEGARLAFMKMGFDAASMNDVTREAGVSKGTLYVYFANKEELFSAMINSERDAFLAAMRMTLAEPETLEAGLYDFGVRFVNHLTDEKVMTAMRIVLGVRDRMPELCMRFFKGPENLRTVLCDFMKRHIDAGALKIAEPDLDLAAGQFLDLASGSYFKLRLFGSMPEPPSPSEIDRTINGAIRVFMAAYGAGHGKDG